MQASIVTSLAYVLALLLCETAAYSFTATTSSFVGTPVFRTIRIIPTQLGTTSHRRGDLLVMKSVWQRVFRRNRGVQTLERETTPATKEKKDPEKLWRVMFHNSEYMPDRVARVLAKIVPTLDRRAAFEICSRARFVGKVPVLVTNKKEAEYFCLAIQRQGLTSTIEPHEGDQR